LAGFPRRYSDYPDCFSIYNQISSLGSVITLIGIVVFLLVIWESFARKRMVRVNSLTPSHLEINSVMLPNRFHINYETIILVHK
jgi:heme/copper-type cytochrome/quinol oxidase subunit 1